MSLLTWYLSGIVICCLLEYMENVEKNEDIVINLELILLIALFSLLGLLLIIPLIGYTYKLIGGSVWVRQLLSKPISMIKIKKDKNDV